VNGVGGGGVAATGGSAASASTDREREREACVHPGVECGEGGVCAGDGGGGDRGRRVRG
jgi:hypothetical protein